MDISKLKLNKPSELTARMPLIDSVGDIVRDANGEDGWIEFYSPDAPAVREFMRRREIQNIKEQRSTRKRAARSFTEIDAEHEYEETRETLVENIAARVSDWRIVTHQGGDVLDAPATAENVKALLGASDFEWLLAAAAEFCLDRSNFFRKTPSD